MAITQIKRDFAPSVSIVRIVSTDTLATVGAANYILNQAANIEIINDGPFNWLITDFVAVSASDGFQFYSISADFKSLNPIFSSGTGSVTQVNTNNGLTGGPITTTGTIGLATIGADTVLANVGVGNAVPTATTVTSLFDSAFGNTQGEILYRNATVWTTLSPGTSGQVLVTGGAGANPAWTTVTMPTYPLALNLGGTNAALVADAGGVVYSTASALAIQSPAGSVGQVLLSGGSGAPDWSTPTYPALSGTAGQIIRSDGTNNVYSTATFANTYSASNLLYSNGANTVTGLATANDGVLVTSNAGVPSILAGSGTTGNILQSNAAAAPSWSTATYPSTTTANQILYSSSNNVVAGISTANSAVLLTNSSGAPSFSNSLTNGQLIVGSTGASPVATTLTAGSNITITNGAGSITIATTGPGSFTYVDTTGTTQAMSANTGYVADNAGLVTFTLPATAAQFSIVEIVGNGAGGWTLLENTGQTIHVGNLAATTSTGSVSSTNQYDQIKLICTVTNSTWVAQHVIGNLTIV